MITVSWFSGGVSSAVATWLAIEMIDRIIYQHIDDQHPDTLRFIRDCEAWFNKPVEVIQSPLKSVENACRLAAYINGVRGAACSVRLKRRLRLEWEQDNQWFNTFRYVWGMDASRRERERAAKLACMTEYEHLFPLIERGIGKAEAHGILAKAGIARPAMYDLGYSNNNCVGCVKGGAGYWNKIRRDFPLVFLQRAEMERAIGASCINGVYLDELSIEAGRTEKAIAPECGMVCETVV